MKPVSTFKTNFLNMKTNNTFFYIQCIEHFNHYKLSQNDSKLDIFISAH